ncbi:DUF998 domain-containing protein [Ruania halotolerans]|uniref:DUF998 domain-containing protein n=1 Tax=Ruania halotolerans TaxID=2897773 RepID=UPI001E4EBB56|nr:DUF998 domain-containing protein [Ruania halotolerans]UFU05343.1 DUF998 domain-containing protein [Ruania halotolerans]
MGAISAVLFMLVFTLDGWSRSGYRPCYHPVSALALGSRGWLQKANFIICGGGIAVGGLALMGTSTLLAAVIGIFGLALVASGVFTMDPMRGYPPRTPAGDPATFSRQHQLHDYAGVVVFAAVPIAATVAAVTPELGGVLRAYSAVAAAAGTAGFLIFGQAWEQDSPRAGLWQRVTILVGWSWVAAVLTAGS